MAPNKFKDELKALGDFKRINTIKQKDITDKLIVEKATMSELSIALRSKGRPVCSVKFHHTPNKNPGVKGSKPVSLKVERGGRVKRLTGGNGRSSAFMATMPNGTEGIFQRNGEIVAKTVRKGAYSSIRTRTGKSKSGYSGRVSTKVGRENIVQVSSPGVVQMLKNKKVRKSIQKGASERFNKELDHQVKYLLDQQKG